MAAFLCSLQEALIALLLNVSWDTHTGWLASFKATRVIIGGRQPNSALHALFSVFLWTLKFSTVFSLHSVSLSTRYSKFVPFSLATITRSPPPPPTHENPLHNKLIHKCTLCNVMWLSILLRGSFNCENRSVSFCLPCLLAYIDMQCLS